MIGSIFEFLPFHHTIDSNFAEFEFQKSSKYPQEERYLREREREFSHIQKDIYFKNLRKEKSSCSLKFHRERERVLRKQENVIDGIETRKRDE